MVYVLVFALAQLGEKPKLIVSIETPLSRFSYFPSALRLLLKSNTHRNIRRGLEHQKGSGTSEGAWPLSLLCV